MGAYDCDCINNLEYDRRERKAQLSQEDATKDATSELIERQQAIDRFNVIRPVDPKKDEYTKGIDVGIAMCIVAVKDQPTVQPETEKRMLESPQNVPDDELISKKAAIDAAKEAVIADEQPYVENALKSVPSVQQENGTGEWVTYYKYDNAIGRYEWKRCSKCGKDMFSHETEYCPRCGARMKGVKRETD